MMGSVAMDQTPLTREMLRFYKNKLRDLQENTQTELLERLSILRGFLLEHHDATGRLETQLNELQHENTSLSAEMEETVKQRLEVIAVMKENEGLKEKIRDLLQQLTSHEDADDMVIIDDPTSSPHIDAIQTHYEELIAQLMSKFHVAQTARENERALSTSHIETLSDRCQRLETVVSESMKDIIKANSHTAILEERLKETEEELNVSVYEMQSQLDLFEKEIVQVRHEKANGLSLHYEEHEEEERGEAINEVMLPEDGYFGEQPKVNGVAHVDVEQLEAEIEELRHALQEAEERLQDVEQQRLEAKQQRDAAVELKQQAEQQKEEAMQQSQEAEQEKNYALQKRQEAQQQCKEILQKQHDAEQRCEDAVQKRQEAEQDRNDALQQALDAEQLAAEAKAQADGKDYMLHKALDEVAGRERMLTQHYDEVQITLQEAEERERIANEHEQLAHKRADEKETELAEILDEVAVRENALKAQYEELQATVQQIQDQANITIALAEEKEALLLKAFDEAVIREREITLDYEGLQSALQHATEENQEREIDMMNRAEQANILLRVQQQMMRNEHDEILQRATNVAAQLYHRLEEIRHTNTVAEGKVADTNARLLSLHKRAKALDAFNRHKQEDESDLLALKQHIVKIEKIALQYAPLNDAGLLLAIDELKQSHVATQIKHKKRRKREQMLAGISLMS